MNHAVDAIQKWNHMMMRVLLESVFPVARKYNMSRSHLGALLHLYHHRLCGVSSIGLKMGITCAAASQMLDRLVQDQLVERTEDPNDRRGKKISLTEKGRELVEDALQTRQSWIQQLVEAFSVEEQHQIAHYLTLLREKAEDLHPLPSTSFDSLDLSPDS